MYRIAGYYQGGYLKLPAIQGGTCFLKLPAIQGGYFKFREGVISNFVGAILGVLP